MLLHPLGSSHIFWEDCIPEWTKRYRVVACDLRGAGRSPIPERPWKVNEHVRDLIGLREMLGLRDVIPVGCASGSVLATAYAAADKDVVRALVLSNTTNRLGEESRQRHESRLKLVAEKGFEALLPMVIDMAFDGLPKDERYWRYYERFRGNNPQGYGSLALGMIGTDNSAILPALACPTLVTVGAKDILLPPPLSRAVHEAIPRSEFATMENAAHFAPYQAPQDFARLVNDFLNRRLT
jgi:pimeloyl-ACP methyl ester carboxylesterase